MIDVNPNTLVVTLTITKQRVAALPQPRTPRNSRAGT